ncbi:unnamed protein product [Dibothriocephalus latus]|uniref:Uncharacterized protein n=1 Tax=Dibothriocephalus latus TaxID=60516 RepID=A0A3P7LR56_DIBLA|nr:unnamed protein product [Dibothriocephalus latus]
MKTNTQTSFANADPTPAADGIPSFFQRTLTRHTDLPSKFNAAKQTPSQVVEMTNILQHADARVVEIFPPTSTQTQLPRENEMTFPPPKRHWRH